MTDEKINEKLRKYYDSIGQVWKYMKTFLLRHIDETYWSDLVDQSYHGPDEFTARLYVAAIREIERVKKCTNES